MNLVFGELSITTTLPTMEPDRANICDSAGRDIDIEKGDRLFLGSVDPFNTFVMTFDHTSYDYKSNDTIELVSSDEHRYLLKDYCLIIKC